MNFENEKKQCLAKVDRSKKGKIDDNIKKLVDLINSNKNYYTTSSCSGRIMVLTQDRKDRVKWLYTTHKEADSDEIWQALKELPQNQVLFKLEAPILHICAKNIEAAEKLLDIANKAGFRRSGIISMKRRVIEIIAPESIAAPIAEKIILIDKPYLDYLVASANDLLKKSRKRMDKLSRLLASQ